MERDTSSDSDSTSGTRAAQNRVALLTPQGSGAIAVVRIAGPGVAAFLQSSFSGRTVEGRCVHGILRDGAKVIDDPVVVLSANGQIADINLHGGPWVIKACLDLAKRNRFELIERLPDVSANKIEQEMLDALPEARTERALRLLLEQPQLWVSAKLDGNSIESILQDRTLWWMLHPPRIAIIGIPNAGKSTLANQLFGQDRSITADVPGTTRDWVGDWTQIDGLPILLIDTPGLRNSEDEIEQAAIAQSREQIDQADLVLAVLDPTGPLAEQKAAMDKAPANPLLIINKSDLPAVWDSKEMDAVAIVALSGAGIDQLKQRIRDRFITRSSERSLQCWTQRQRDILMRAMQDPSLISKLF